MKTKNCFLVIWLCINFLTKFKSYSSNKFIPFCLRFLILWLLFSVRFCLYGYLIDNEHQNQNEAGPSNTHHNEHLSGVLHSSGSGVPHVNRRGPRYSWDERLEQVMELVIRKDFASLNWFSLDDSELGNILFFHSLQFHVYFFENVFFLLKSMGSKFIVLKEMKFQRSKKRKTFFCVCVSIFVYNKGNLVDKPLNIQLKR